MATHDYVIDNSTGANVRADINSVLQAILTNNSSSSAPSTTAAYMFWADTTTGILKIRNSANDGWVELLQLDGTLTLEDGSASTPALAFRDDLDTGIFSSAANNINFATGGVERLELSGSSTIFNESGADVNFRVEGDTNVNLLFVDAGQDRIGVNENVPLGKFHIKSTDSSVSSVNSGADELVLENNGSCGLSILSSTTNEGIIAFGDSGSNSIGKVSYNHSSNSLTFVTNSSEAFRIDSSGRMLIGITSTSQTHTLQVQSDSSAQAIAIYGRNGDDIGEIAYWEYDGTTKLGELQYRQDHLAIRHRVGHIEFATTYSGNSVSERMRVVNDQLCIGTTAGVGLATSRRLQIRGTTHSNVGMNILITANDSNPASIDLGKSRSTGNAILGNNDDVGQINFYGNDGSGFHSMARILCRCQGHDTSDNDLPSTLAFSTLTENSTTLRERLIIDDEGIHSIGSENHALNVSTTASSGTNKYNFRGHHSGTVGQPGSGTLSFTVWSNGNVENLNNSYGSTSDIKLKENIVDANSQWNDIKAIKIRNYNFKEETGQDTKTQIGLVAQELETVCPKLIYETPDFDDKGEDLGTTTKCISYSVLYIKAIKALQESMAKIEVLETKVAALEAG